MCTFRSMHTGLKCIKSFFLIIKLVVSYEVFGAKSFHRAPELCFPVYTQLFEHENFLLVVF